MQIISHLDPDYAERMAFFSRRAEPLADVESAYRTSAKEAGFLE